jgi:hypothetical protein
VIERLTLISVEHLGLRLRCLEVDVSRGTLSFVGIAAQMDLMALYARSTAVAGQSASFGRDASACRTNSRTRSRGH